MLAPDSDKSDIEIGQCFNSFQMTDHGLPLDLPVDGAAQRGHWNVVEKILSRAALASLNLALCYALKDHRHDIADELINAGASVRSSFEIDRKPFEFHTALQLAACSGAEEAVKRIIREDAFHPHEDLGSALQAAARKGFLQICVTLVTAGADISAPGSEYRGVKTALEEAAANGRLDVAHFLLAANEDTSRYSEQIPKAVRAARENGFLTVARYIHNWDVALGVSRVDEAGRPADLLTK